MDYNGPMNTQSPSFKALIKRMQLADLVEPQVGESLFKKIDSGPIFTMLSVDARTNKEAK